MNIDRHNYEEFFILYLDNELSATDRQRVEEFADANPDLKAELDLLLQSKLIPENDIVFDAKTSLLKSEEIIAAETSAILLYLDNEMNTGEKKSFEEWLAGSSAAQRELKAFQQTKLSPETIVFPYKDSLYREEERRVVAIRWWRMAAAAVLLLGASTATFMFNQNKATRNLARNNQQQQEKGSLAQVKTNSNSSTTQLDAIPQTSTPSAEAKEHAASGDVEKAQAAQENLLATEGNRTTTSKANTSAQNTDLEKNDQVAATSVEEDDYKITKRGELSHTLETSFAVNSDALRADPSLTIQKQINPLPAVTQEEDQPLDIMNEPGKKNRFRGFFRKITRTFEKTTNIKATDGEDRLLVGGLAIKF